MGALGHTVLPYPCLLYKNTVFKEAAMIRIVCPFCHSPLRAADLETATLEDRICLVCPECEQILLMEEAPLSEAPVSEPVVEPHA